MSVATRVAEGVHGKPQVVDLSEVAGDQVLVVEDDEADATLIKEMLLSRGVSADVATTLSEAERLLVERAYKCILLDLHLPDAVGTAAIESLLNIALETPVIVVTGLDDESMAIGALRLGVQDYLVKGRATADDLSRTIHRSIERKRVERETAREAMHDPLTGVPNRRYFMSRVEDAIERSASRDGIVAVLFVDLDDFKHVNDTFGHQGGDLLLIELARRLTEAVRPRDVVARFGGDEFVVLCEDVAARDTADEIAQRVAKACDRGYAIDGVEVAPRVSIGIATTEAGASSATTLIRLADVAMYRAKRMRDNEQRVVARGSDPPRSIYISGPDAAMIERSDIRIDYQPVISVGTMETVAVEALCRWQHPEAGLILPSAFIPSLERTGGIREVGLWVLHEACRSIQEVAPASTEISLNVNLSPIQVQPVLIPNVLRILATYGIAPTRLTLELTETADSILCDEHLEILADLSRDGVRIALDDFGTGYSSLKRAATLPIDMIKLDRSFTVSLSRSPEAVAVTRNVLELGHDLGAQVVAEGVEDVAQWEVLNDCGYELVQGNLIQPAGDSLAAALQL
jgi:diguanylate cyclase (GGDEF)-like protein